MIRLFAAAVAFSLAVVVASGAGQARLPPDVAGSWSGNAPDLRELDSRENLARPSHDPACCWFNGHLCRMDEVRPKADSDCVADI